MRLIAITQRVDIIDNRDERRDALDQTWTDLMASAGFTVLILPNNKDAVVSLLNAVSISGIVLTGGNDLADYGGLAPERDEMELYLLELAISKKIPVLGVCRGMQFIQNYWNIPIQKVENQVLKNQEVVVNSIIETVNSFHCWGCYDSSDAFETFAISLEGIIKGIKHKILPIMGIMWHPERIIPYREQDIDLIRKAFS